MEDKRTAFLSWSLMIKCPRCEYPNDLADGDHDIDGTYSEPIFNNNWDKLVDEDVFCSECGHDFPIKKVEY